MLPGLLVVSLQCQKQFLLLNCILRNVLFRLVVRLILLAAQVLNQVQMVDVRLLRRSLHLHFPLLVVRGLLLLDVEVWNLWLRRLHKWKLRVVHVIRHRQKVKLTILVIKLLLGLLPWQWLELRLLLRLFLVLGREVLLLVLALRSLISLLGCNLLPLSRRLLLAPKLIELIWWLGLFLNAGRSECLIRLVYLSLE